MQPPGLAFNAVSAKALEVSKTARLPSVYWDWHRRLETPYYRRFCGTPPEHLLFALREGLDMIFEEGLENAFARHHRIAQAVRRAVAVWSRGNTLSLNAIEASEMSNSVTTVLVANGYDIDQFRATCRERFNVSIATGLGKTMGKAFRIGHMGHVNEPMIIGALAGVEATLSICDIPHEAGGVDAAVRFLASA
jgi:alanine-glyoxylate transaminase/serine-glyoxylate transaminase/serine-pyruvate transaminase